MKHLIKQAGLLLVMMAVGTLVDWIVHSSREAWYVEPSYYSGKIIFGVIWGLFSLYVLRRVLAVNSSRYMALGVPALIALFLQTKYFYQGRALSFVFIFLFLHFLMFLPASLVIFSRWRGVFLSGPVPKKPRWLAFVTILLCLEVLFYAYFKIFPPFH
jgi:hypothetical protein